MRKLMLKSFVFVLAIISIASCNKFDQLDEEFAEETIQGFAIETRSGAGGCYELVFPIEVDYPDATSESYDSFDELKAAIQLWKEENGGGPIADRPQLVYPIEIINEEGEVISVEDRATMRELRKECRREKAKMRPCFRFEYPVSLVFPDGEVMEFEDRKALKMAVRNWKMNNPDADERPMLEFPVSIKYKDGTIVEIASKEALIEAKAACE